MPGPEQGFTTAFFAMITGAITFAMIAGIAPTLGETGNLVVSLLSLLSIITMITLFSKMEHWSLAYLLGYILGISLFGSYLLSVWEFQLSMIFGSFYAIVKIMRKAKRAF